jgi:hypothetical protein
MDYFRVPRLRRIHSTPLDPKRCLVVFHSNSLTFGMSKDAKLVFRAWMDYFRVPKLRSINSTPLDTNWCLGVFRSISLTLGVSKEAKLVFRAWMHYFEVPKLRSVHPTTSAPKWLLGAISAISLTNGNKSWETCVLDVYALFCVTEVAKHPSYYIGRKMMFGSHLDHFANLQT